MKRILGMMAISLSLVACNNDDDNDDMNDLVILADYISADFDANTVDQKSFNDELSALSSAQKAADDGSEVTEQSLFDAWDGTALKNGTATDFVPIVNAELPVLAVASNHDYDWSTAPNNDGGFFENRVFSPQGLECVQMVEKGLFGAAQYYQAQMMIEQKGDNLSAADIDGMVVLFGTTPAFPNTDQAAENPDAYQAKYAARRTPSSGGMYLDIEQSFIEARTYAEAGSAYNAQKAASIASVMENWEKSIVATAINYMHATISKMSQTNPDNATIEDGMHAYGEGIGFFTGLRACPAKYRMFTDAEGDEVLEHMLVPFDSYMDNSERESYNLTQGGAGVVDAVNELTKALSELQGIYSFSDQEMEDFKVNWVNTEGRQ